MPVAKYWDGAAWRYLSTAGPKGDPGYAYVLAQPTDPGPPPHLLPAGLSKSPLWVDTDDPTGSTVIVADASWIVPTLLNGWTNYGQGWSGVAYRKLSSGMVVIKGTVASGIISSLGIIFALPVGYRPSESMQVATVCSPSAAARLDVMSNGDVIAHAASTGGSNAYFSVECSFYVNTMTVIVVDEEGQLFAPEGGSEALSVPDEPR